MIPEKPPAEVPKPTEEEKDPKQVETAIVKPKAELPKPKVEAQTPGIPMLDSAFTTGVGVAITKFFKQVGGASLKAEEEKVQRSESVQEELWREMNQKLTRRKTRMALFRNRVKTVEMLANTTIAMKTGTDYLLDDPFDENKFRKRG